MLMISDSNIQIDGLKIRIRTAGKGRRAIVFIHGNSCSADYWIDQLIDADLRNNFKLIAMDLPGHGSSEKLIDYSLGHISNILLLAIDSLLLGGYILAGLSYGTALIAEVAPKLLNCKGFFLASPNVTSDDYPPSSYIIPFPELLTMIAGAVEEDELRKFAAHLTNDPSSLLVEKFISSYKETDPRFRIDLGTAMQHAAWSDEFSNLIKTGLPVMYIFGESDLALNIYYMDSIKLPANHSLVFLKDAAHFINIDQSEKINGLLIEFSKNAFH